MALSIPCPQCEKRLKLPGPEVLGKSAKCPACGHRFKLRLPESKGKRPPAPKTAPPPDPEPAGVANPASSEMRATLPVGLNPRYVDDIGESAAAWSIPRNDAEDTAGRSASPRRRRRRGVPPAVWGGVAAVAVAAAAGAYAVWPDAERGETPRPQAVVKSDDAAPARSTIAIESPTRGESVPTTLLPAGVSVLVHLRPADVFETGGAMADLRGSLPPSVIPASRRLIEDLSGRQVADIEEATIGVVLGSRGVPPRYSGVFRTVSERDIGEWLQSIGGGAENLGGDVRLVRGPERATLIRDGRTFAVSPAEFADDLLDAVNVPQPNISPAIAPLVDRTDRTRHLTILAGRNDLEIHAGGLLPDAGSDLLRGVLETVDDSASAAVWSLHQTDRLYSEFVFAPKPGVTPVSLQKSLTKTVDGLPSRMMSGLRRHNPPQEGVRAVAGRYPAMLEAARLSTAVDTGRSDVTVRTLLPAVAGPNLVVGSVVTYNVLATDVGAAVAAAPVERADTRPLAERLQTPLDAEFARMPLQEAIAYIAEEAGLTIDIDGDGLKLAGYTQNMPQTFDLGSVPAGAALAKILSQYEKMRLAKTDAETTLRLTTVDALGEADLVPLPESP